MIPLAHLLDTYRAHSQSEREKGTYFEQLILCYLKHETSYRELYDGVCSDADVGKKRMMSLLDS